MDTLGKAKDAFIGREVTCRIMSISFPPVIYAHPYQHAAGTLGEVAF